MSNPPPIAEPIVVAPAAEPLAIDYAGRNVVRPPSNALRLVTLWLAGIASGVGVALVLMYAVSPNEWIAISGFYWLGIGGLMTLIAFITGITYSLVARGRRFPPPSTARRAVIAVLWPILNLPLAFACAWGGLGLMDYHANAVVITNEGKTTIDLVRLHSPSFQTTIGPLKSGATKRVHLPKLPSELLQMEVIVGGIEMPYDVSQGMDADPMRGPRYVTLDGLTVYKNRMRSPP